MNKRIFTYAAAAISVICLSVVLVMTGVIGTDSGEGSTSPDTGKAGLSARASAADTVTSSEQDRPASLPDIGEPIPGEYIVKTSDGSFKLVKTRSPEKLKKKKGIVGVEQNRVVGAFGTDDKSASAITGEAVAEMQYGDKMVKAPQAWEMIRDMEKTKVRVAVIDTGVDASHPDLAGKVLPGHTIVERTSKGNLYADDGNDDNDHGTHVAGIIAATVDNGIGINGVTGNVDLEILPVKVLDDSGRGSTFDIIEGLRYAADHGASIINLSLGSYSSSEMEAEAVRYAQNKGCLVIAAAGNDSFNVQYTYPASYEDVLSVGAVDDNGERAYYSNFGDTLDVAAPGSAIVSTIPKTIAKQKIAQGETVYGNDDEGYYMSMSGTSMATPHAAGVAAIYKAVHPSETGFDIAALMIDTCQDVGDPGKDIETGAGIVDAQAMLGGEIIKTPLAIKSPSDNQEVYEQVPLSAHINHTMGITSLKYYLDEAAPENLIAELDCDAENAFYDTVWDTTRYPDGTHKLIAVVSDAEGTVIDQKELTVKVLNSITDGFTLEVADPEGNPAQEATYRVFEQSSDGYVLAGKGRTNTLGYARVKGLSESSEDFILVVTGVSKIDAGGDIRYAYRRVIDADQRGSKIHVDGQQSREVDFSAVGEDGDELEAPYLKLYIDNGSGWISDESAVRIQSDTHIFVDDGTYKAAVFRAADRKGTAYCIEKEFDISESASEMTFGISDGIKVKAVYPADSRGEMSLEGANAESEIPFLSGIMYGTTFYLTKGKEYRADVKLEAEDSAGELWSLSLEKKDNIITDHDQNVEFAPQIGVHAFDYSGGDLHVGDKLRTECTFGDAQGDRLISMMGHFPVLRIYKTGEGGERTLVYEKESRWYTESPIWDSAKDYDGSVPPAAGSYVAQLSFDAGPFGGETSEETAFEMKTRSGHDEMSSTIRIKEGDKIYKAFEASMDLYTWDASEKAWKKATKQNIPKSDTDQGVVRGIYKDEIQLDDSGVNVAVITLSERRYQYEAVEKYSGFAAVPFGSPEDLQEITIDADQLSSVSVRAYDRAGNPKAADISLPVSSDGGALSAPAFVKDHTCRIQMSAPWTVLHIPQGTYEYMYAKYNDSNDNYLLENGEFTTALEETTNIRFNGQDTVRLTVNAPECDSFNVKLIREGTQRGPAVSLASDHIYMYPGKYNVSAIMTDTEGEYRYTIRRPDELHLSQDTSWSVSSEMTAGVSLKQKKIAEDQTLTGEAIVTDTHGNTVTRIEKMQPDEFFGVIRPTLHISGEDGSETDLGETDLGEFYLTNDQYNGAGFYSVWISFDDNELITSEKSSFLAGATDRKPSWKSAAKLAHEWTDKGVLSLSWKAGDVIKAAENAGIEGYRLYYSDTGIRWTDLTGDELIRETNAKVEMPLKKDYWIKVEAVDEFGSVSEDGPQAEVLGQYPYLTVSLNDGKDVEETEFYLADLQKMEMAQARYSALNNYGTRSWYAATGLYLDDLIKGMGVKSYDRISVSSGTMDPINFTPDDAAGKGYYYYPKDYDGETVKAQTAKPMIALMYTTAEDREPDFGGVSEGAMRLIFGQQGINDVNKAWFMKEVYGVTAYGVVREGQGGDDTDTQTHPTAAEAAAAKVDSTLLSRVAASGITTTPYLKTNKMKISFKAVKNAKAYRITYKKASASKWTSVWAVNGRTSYTLKSLKKKALYQFRITPFAKKDGKWVRGNMSVINYRYFAAVSSPKASAKGKRRVAVSWKTLKGSTGYQILYSTAKTMKGAKIKTVKGVKKKTALLSKLKKGKRYYIQVRPYRMYKGNKYIGAPGAKKVVKVR